MGGSPNKKREIRRKIFGCLPKKYCGKQPRGEKYGTIKIRSQKIIPYAVYAVHYRGDMLYNDQTSSSGNASGEEYTGNN
jgi:hypothetical protein